MKQYLPLFLIAAALVLVILFIRFKRPSRVEAVMPKSKSIEELSKAFMAGEGSLGPNDLLIAHQLKAQGYCAGFGGKGIVAQRWVCKEGDFNAMMASLKCNCNES